MSGFVEMRDLFVHPVHRQRILNQIVGADAEKARPLGQGISNHHRGGNFDHGSGRELGIESMIAGPQLGLDFFDQCVGLVHLVHA